MTASAPNCILVGILLQFRTLSFQMRRDFELKSYDGNMGSSFVLSWKDREDLSTRWRNESGVFAVDRISDLPTLIKQDILSRLNTGDAVRTCVLSKMWRNEWNMLPNLSFVKQILPPDVQADKNSTYLYKNRHRLQEIFVKKEAFLNFIDQFLQRRASEEFPNTLQKLSLHVPFARVNIATHIDQWLTCAINCGVRKLHLDTAYKLPERVFNADFLTQLKLSSCKIILYNPHMIRLSSLLKLSLANVHVAEQTLTGIITSCYKMKKLSLMHCSGFNKLEISGIPKLEKLKVSHSEGLKIAVFDAMHLQAFTCTKPLGLMDEVNVATCKNICHLKLDTIGITDEQLSFHLSHLHLLEDLCLIFCNSLRIVEISAPNLKYLSLNYCRKLHKANIDAPKLESFTYCADNIITLSMNVSSSTSVRIEIPFRNTYALCLARFVKFLTEFNCCSPMLTLNIKPNMVQNGCLPKEQRRMFHSPLWNVRHMKVELNSSEVLESLAETIDTILWLSPRLDSLTIPLLPSGLLDCYMIKGLQFYFMYNDIIDDREDEEDHSCCSISIKCWRHSLKEVKIQNLTNLEAAAKLKDLFETSRKLERIEGLPVEANVSLSDTWQNHCVSCLL